MSKINRKFVSFEGIGCFGLSGCIENATLSGQLMNLAYLWVALGGALGSVLRFGLNGLISARFGETFPWGTLIINVTGSFLIGVFAAFADPDGRYLVSPGLRQFLMMGVCGGYTTFSSFSLQTLNLLRISADFWGLFCEYFSSKLAPGRWGNFCLNFLEVFSFLWKIFGF